MMRWLCAGALATLALSADVTMVVASCVSPQCTDAAAIERAREIIQETCGCTRDGQTHGTYKLCVRSTLKLANLTAIIPQKPCRKLIRKCENASICGKPNAGVCCVLKSNGSVKSSIVKSARECERGGVCGVPGFYSKFDACADDGSCDGSTAVPGGDIRCCIRDDSGTECEDRTPAECVAQRGTNIGAGSCTPNPCGTPIPLPGGGSPTVTVTCERRPDRSRVSVNGNDLAAGSYQARITSGANRQTSGPRTTVGDEVEFDFDSAPDDIAAGATAIATGFLQGTPPQVTGEILDAGGVMVIQATATCTER